MQNIIARFSLAHYKFLSPSYFDTLDRKLKYLEQDEAVRTILDYNSRTGLTSENIYEFEIPDNKMTLGSYMFVKNSLDIKQIRKFAERGRGNIDYYVWSDYDQNIVVNKITKEGRKLTEDIFSYSSYNSEKILNKIFEGEELKSTKERKLIYTASTKGHSFEVYLNNFFASKLFSEDESYNGNSIARKFIIFPKVKGLGTVIPINKKGDYGYDFDMYELKEKEGYLYKELQGHRLVSGYQKLFREVTAGNKKEYLDIYEDKISKDIDILKMFFETSPEHNFVRLPQIKYNGVEISMQLHKDQEGGYYDRFLGEFTKQIKEDPLWVIESLNDLVDERNYFPSIQAGVLEYLQEHCYLLKISDLLFEDLVYRKKYKKDIYHELAPLFGEDYIKRISEVDPWTSIKISERIRQNSKYRAIFFKNKSDNFMRWWFNNVFIKMEDSHRQFYYKDAYIIPEDKEHLFYEWLKTKRYDTQSSARKIINKFGKEWLITIDIEEKGWHENQRTVILYYYDKKMNKLYESEQVINTREIDFKDIFSNKKVTQTIRKGIGSILKKLKNDIENKISENILYKIEPEAFKSRIVNISDSTNVGNCEVGTMDFIEKYELKEGETTLTDLIQLFRDNKNSNLKRVIANIFVKEYPEVVKQYQEVY